MEYFVTGATGFIGSHLVERLLADGHEVVALTRDRSNAADLPGVDGDRVTVVEGDLTEKASMRGAMAGTDGVFHLAAWFRVGPGPWNERTAERVNVEGTRNVLELMAELDIEKGVYASTVGAYGNTGGEYVDESYRATNDFPSVYQETKWRAHYEVAEPMMAEGLPLVIATLGVVYGPGDKTDGGSARSGFRDYLQGDLPLLPADFVMPWDYVVDTADALVRAMDRGTPGEEYIVTNEPRSFVDVFEIAEEVTGVSSPRMLPGRVFDLLGTGVSAVERVTRPPEGFESETLSFFATGEVLVDNAKAKRELGIEHRPLREGLREYLVWEMDQLGMEPPAGSTAAEPTSDPVP